MRMINYLRQFARSIKQYIYKTPLTHCFFYGLLLPFAFAPFHIPGFAIISLAFFYNALSKPSPNAPHFNGFWLGLAYGLGFFGLGTSWIYVSIHEYGHLVASVAAFITLIFTLYLSLFPAFMAYSYQHLRTHPNSWISIVLFSALWTLSEYLRATLFTGFPWLLVGMGQIDAPMRNLLPVVGVYGVTFLTCVASGVLVLLFRQSQQIKRLLPLMFFLFIVLTPQLLHRNEASKTTTTPLTVGIIQSNLSMRDKWDEQLFWKIVDQYKEKINGLLGTNLIVLPEAAFPVPSSYIEDLLKQLSKEAKQAGSAILLGIPETTNFDDSQFYNSLLALGNAEGLYRKQHLVPFGEFYPKLFQVFTRWIELPNNMQPGSRHQKLIQVNQLPIATLICYELAYGHLLREQIPNAQFIVSISDDGWFGHSLAMYQQLQIAQVQSVQTARYQVVANNDGLSSIIDADGNVTESLKPFTAGTLKADLIPQTTLTPWVKFGDTPTLLFVGLISLLCIALRHRKKSPNDHLLPLTQRGVILTGQLENNE